MIQVLSLFFILLGTATGDDQGWKWIAVHHNVMIDFDLEETAIEVKTDSEVSTDENVDLRFYTADVTEDTKDDVCCTTGGIGIRFKSTVRYSFDYCSSSYSDFPSTLPSTPDKIWKITLTRTGGVRIKIHCNEVEVLNFLMSDTTCGPGWRNYWNKKAKRIYFANADIASNQYRPHTEMARQRLVFLTLAILVIGGARCENDPEVEEPVRFEEDQESGGEDPFSEFNIDTGKVDSLMNTVLKKIGESGIGNLGLSSGLMESMMMNVLHNLEKTGSEDIKENAMKLESLVDGAFKKIDPTGNGDLKVNAGMIKSLLNNMFKGIDQTGGGDSKHLMMKVETLNLIDGMFKSLDKSGNGEFKINAEMLKPHINNLLKSASQAWQESDHPDLMQKAKLFAVKLAKNFITNYRKKSEL